MKQSLGCDPELAEGALGFTRNQFVILSSSGAVIPNLWVVAPLANLYLQKNLQLITVAKLQLLNSNENNLMLGGVTTA